MAKRISKVDWLDAGLKVLGELGASALTIEKLCEVLGKSKGSFYHHFVDMNGFIGGLLEHWQLKQTQAAIDQANSVEGAANRMAALDQAVRKLDHGLEMVIRHWAREDERAAAALTKVDAMRLSYLENLYQQMGSSPEIARAWAELEYTTFVGAQLRFEDMNSEPARAVETFLHAAVRKWNETKLHD
jgi:AcrR family transcriptional regulator